MLRILIRWQSQLVLLMLMLTITLIAQLAVVLKRADVIVAAADRSAAARGTSRAVRSAARQHRDNLTLFVVTATYRRPEQEADLLRMSQTLVHVPYIFWIVVEDSDRRTPVVASLLKRSGIKHVHLLGKPPSNMPAQRHWGRVPRGVSNRNTGLAWVRRHGGDGVVYFADDDNTYDVRLFPQLMLTRRVSVFPVGLISRRGVSSPVIRSGQVIDFWDGWIGGRMFPVDMAGFAVSTDLLNENPLAEFPYKAGYEEDGFLKSLHVTKAKMEPLANNCTEILVWHTQTQKIAPFERTELGELADTNIANLIHHLVMKPA